MTPHAPETGLKYWVRAGLLTVPVLLIFALGVFGLASESSFPFNRPSPIPFPEAIGAVLRNGAVFGTAESVPAVVWMCIGAATWLGSLILLRHVRNRGVCASICIIRALGPCAPLGFKMFVCIIAGPLFTAAMLSGDVDGEFYSDSMPLFAAAGWWVIFNLVLMPFEILRIAPWTPPGVCAKCRYDLAGIAAEVCPECGSAIVPRK